MVLKKQIKDYGNRRQININKKECNNINEVFIYTIEEYETLQKKINILNNEIAILNDKVTAQTNIINESENNINNEVEATINKYTTKINNYVETIQQQQNLINTLQQDIQQQHKLIKDYEQDTKKHNKEVMELTITISHITNNYNNVRLAIASINKLDILLNRHKDILNQYPALTHNTLVEPIDTPIKKNK